VSEVAERLYMTPYSTPGSVHPEFQIRSYTPTSPFLQKCSDWLISKGELTEICFASADGVRFMEVLVSDFRPFFALC
jgi:hypothetical protein